MTTIEKGVIAVICAILFLSGFVLVGAYNDMVKAKEEAYREGFKAYFNGVSAEANPYQGLALEHSKRWLNGWIASKEQNGPKD